MSTISVRFDGKVFVPEQTVDLPVGTVAQISLPESDLNLAHPLFALVELADAFPEDPEWPEDGAAQVDHYLYGMPKRP